MAHTPQLEQSRHKRKKVEMLFADLKTTLPFEHVRLRGLSGASDGFLMALPTNRPNGIATEFFHRIGRLPLFDE